MDYSTIRKRNGFELSGGELRRFALALGFACEPDLLVLDEPTIGLGGDGKAQLTERALDFSGRHALITMSHDFDPLSAICNNFWILDNGKIVFKGNFLQLANGLFYEERYGLRYFKTFQNSRINETGNGKENFYEE